MYEDVNKVLNGIKEHLESNFSDSFTMQRSIDDRYATLFPSHIFLMLWLALYKQEYVKTFLYRYKIALIVLLILVLYKNKRITCCLLNH